MITTYYYHCYIITIFILQCMMGSRSHRRTGPVQFGGGGGDTHIFGMSCPNPHQPALKASLSAHGGGGGGGGTRAFFSRGPKVSVFYSSIGIEVHAGS